MAPALPNDFKEFLKLLNSHRVKYLVIGGHAVGFYGYPRFTGDIDVWISTAPENVRKVIVALQEFGFDGANLRPELFAKPEHLVRMGNSPVRIEVLTGISGVKFEECFAERVSGIIEGIHVNFISLAHLKANKKASGRYKDLDDLENLSKKRRGKRN